METKITKEYVKGGVNIITTITEFVPSDVLDSRLIDVDQSITDLQTKKDELISDKGQVIKPDPAVVDPLTSQNIQDGIIK